MIPPFRAVAQTASLARRTPVAPEPKAPCSQQDHNNAIGALGYCGIERLITFDQSFPGFPIPIGINISNDRLLTLTNSVNPTSALRILTRFQELGVPSSVLATLWQPLVAKLPAQDAAAALALRACAAFGEDPANVFLRNEPLSNWVAAQPPLPPPPPKAPPTPPPADPVTDMLRVLGVTPPAPPAMPPTVPPTVPPALRSRAAVAPEPAHPVSSADHDQIVYHLGRDTAIEIAISNDIAGQCQPSHIDAISPQNISFAVNQLPKLIALRTLTRLRELGLPAELADHLWQPLANRLPATDDAAALALRACAAFGEVPANIRLAGEPLSNWTAPAGPATAAPTVASAPPPLPQAGAVTSAAASGLERLADGPSSVDPVTPASTAGRAEVAKRAETARAALLRVAQDPNAAIEMPHAVPNNANAQAAVAALFKQACDEALTTESTTFDPGHAAAFDAALLGHVRRRMATALVDSLDRHFDEDVFALGMLTLAHAHKRTALLAPDFTQGEAFATKVPLDLAPLSPEKAMLVDALMELSAGGLAADRELLRHALAVVDDRLLQELGTKGYRFDVGRESITRAAKDLKGARSNLGHSIADAQGVHSTNGKQNRILVVSTMQDGKLTLDVQHLFHEIGHAIDLVLRADKKGAALAADPEFVAAWTAEKTSFPQAYFHELGEFAAQTIGLFMRNPAKFTEQCPQTAAFLKAKANLPEQCVDNARLLALHHRMLVQAPVTTSVAPDRLLASLEALNTARVSQHGLAEAYLVALDGEERAARAVARQMASALSAIRRPDLGPGGPGDGFLELDAALLNDRTRLEESLAELATGHGGLLFVANVSALSQQSTSWPLLRKFLQKNDGKVVVAFHDATTSGREAFAEQFQGFSREAIALSPLSPAQSAELVRRHIANAGYNLSNEALARLSEKAGGGYDKALSLWDQVKAAQTTRLRSIDPAFLQRGSTVFEVLSCDVEGAKLAAPAPSPLKELGEMLKTQPELRTYFGDLISALKKGLGPKRLNVAVEGNPGIGKTTMTGLFARAITQQGLWKSKRPKDVTILSPKAIEKDPATAIIQAFETSKFVLIDEAHQLDKKALEVLVPLLTDDRYADVACFVLGYPGRLGAMLNQDDGGKSRFATIRAVDAPNAMLRVAAEKEAAKRGLRLGAGALDSLMAWVDRERRFMKFFDNFRRVEKALDYAAQKAAGAGDADPFADTDMSTASGPPVLLPEHFAPAAPEPLADVLRDVDAQPGNAHIKRLCHNIAKTVQANTKLGQSLWQGVPPALYLDGPPGTGKTTITELLARLYHSLGLVAENKPVKKKWPDLQGEYLGQTAGHADKFFDEFVGRVGLVDEAYGSLGYKEAEQIALVRVEENNVDPRGLITFAGYDAAEFFALNPGYASRMQVVTLDRMTEQSFADEVTRLVQAQLKGKPFAVTDLQPIRASLNAMVAAPEFAHRRDVRDLATALVAAAQIAWVDADMPQTLRVSPHVLKSVAETFLKGVLGREKKQHVPKQAVAATATQSVTEQQAVSEEERELDSGVKDDHQAYLALIQQPKWAQLSISDPAAFERQTKAADSDFARELAQQMGVAPEVAIDRTQKALVKVIKYTEYQIRTKKRVFQYVCFNCGGIDGSNNCGFFRENQNNKEWLIAHSLRKPYDVETIETRTQETVETKEIDVPGAQR